MKDQPNLFVTSSCWGHYIGGYYKDIETFIAEAMEFGVSRRAPAMLAMGMHYGDRVVLLRYHGKGNVEAFGEMVITNLFLDEEAAQAVAEQVKCQYVPDGQVVTRECGEYTITGTWVIEADIPEIVRIAMQSSKFVMIGGALTREYETPVHLSPAPKFTRGFMRMPCDASYEYSPQPGQVVGVAGYAKASKSKIDRRERQYASH
jgi:hypothetical protein